MATLLTWRAHWHFPGVRSSDPATTVRTVRGWAIAALLLLSLSGCATSEAPSSSNPPAFPSGTGGVGGGTALGTNAASASPTSEATPPPKATLKPTAPAPPAPAPVRPTQPAAAPPVSNTCGAPANPWGYNFCGGSFISSPPSNFCAYFICIPSFWKSTNGYVEQCADGMYSHSGGRSGSCSYHRGDNRPLFRP